MRKSWMLAATLWAAVAAGNSAAVAAHSDAPDKPGAGARPTTPAAKGSAAKTQQPKAQSSKARPSKAQSSKAQPSKAEASKAQTPKGQTPKAEASKAQAPKAQAPKAQTPKAQTPKAQTPKTQTPSTPASMVHVRVVAPGTSSETITPGGQPGQAGGLEQWSGQVVEVTDGDSLIVIFEDTPRRISLHGIDAPERGQAFGAEATGFLKSLVLGKVVQVRLRGRTRDGESLADVTVGANNVSAWMVNDGYAWWHREDARYENDLQQREDAARTARRGLWSEDDPVAPWEFRKRQNAK